MKHWPSRPLALGAFLCASVFLTGCTAIAVTTSVVSVTATAVSLTANAAIGTAKLVGHGVGKAVDVLSEAEQPTNSGVDIRYRTPDGDPLEVTESAQRASPHPLTSPP